MRSKQDTSYPIESTHTVPAAASPTPVDGIVNALTAPLRALGN